MKNLCPADYATFHRLVNMSSREIRSWAKDPRAKCASFPETVQRLTHRQKWKGMTLPSLVELKEKRKDSWSETDCKYARRVNSFNTRHLGQMKRFGCTLRETVALRNWGHMPKCPMPPKGCSTRPPKRG